MPSIDNAMLSCSLSQFIFSAQADIIGFRIMIFLDGAQKKKQIFPLAASEKRKNFSLLDRFLCALVCSFFSFNIKRIDYLISFDKKTNKCELKMCL